MLVAQDELRHSLPTMLSARLRQLILAGARSPARMLAAAAALTVLAMLVVIARFSMTTDTGELISARTPWRVNEAAVEAAFPNLKDAVLVVVDGRTPELASDGAARLTAALAADRAHVDSVEAPDGGPFFAHEGLLFGSVEDVRTATRRLIDAQPLLAPLAADPGLRGAARAIDTAATGITGGHAEPAAAARLQGPLNALAQAIEGELAGKPTFFSWQRLFADGATGPLAAPTRRLLIVHPRLDFGDLEPGAGAVDAVTAAAHRLGIDAAHGARVGITGEVPLADEEFGSIRENIGLVGALMAAAMLVCLWLAVRSLRIVGAIVLTILAGLVMTMALGLLTVGRFNLISVAFIPLFVGLGVDFGIQVAVRFNAERRAALSSDGGDPVAALGRVAGAIGEPLLMAAAAIFLALGAFLPTEYVGIAELGVIAGLGMVIAFLLNITLLPALLVLLRPAVPVREVGWSGAAPVDAWLTRQRHPVLLAFILAFTGTVALLPAVQFDFNPLHLRDPHAPAMRELTELMRDPDRTPNTLSVLAANPDTAAPLAARLGTLPEVDRAMSIDSLIPQDQAPKLALIEDAVLLLDPAINPFDLPPAPDDSQTRAALAKAAAALRALAAAQATPLGSAAGRLAASFDHVAAADPGARARVDAMLAQPLLVTLEAIRDSLQAKAVTRATLPGEIARSWQARDGRALVQVTPRAGPLGLDNAALQRFTASVRHVAPNATGLPIATQEAAHTVARSFVDAGVLALILVSALLYLALRDVREVAFTLAPVVLSGFLTLGSCVLIGQPLNFANIIAFPLLFGVGVAFHIYFVMAWRSGVSNLLQTSLARAVVFSALATGSAFGALWFSHHPGTASMGLILMISLIWTLICALVFEPALLGPPRGIADPGTQPETAT